MKKSEKLVRILRLVDNVSESSPAYNQFSLPVVKKYDISICCFFKPNIPVSTEVQLFEGNDTLGGFLSALNTVLSSGKPFDIVHVHTPQLGLILLLFVFLNKVDLSKTVFTVHNSFQNFKFRNRILLIPIFCLFKAIVCCSVSSYESFPRFYKGLARNRLSAVQNGLDIDRVDEAILNFERTEKQKHKITILTISRFVPIKNLKTIIDALHCYKGENVELVIVGDGRLRRDLSKEVDDRGLTEQVFFTGRIPRDAVYAQLLKADLYISTSLGEGLPIAVLEAMACRCPLILSDISPHREIAKGANFIPLVRPNDVEGFALEIGKFLRMSSSERQDIGALCRKLVEEHFNLHQMLDQYDDIFSRVIRMQTGG